MTMNKLEAYLLRLVIPFKRIAHVAGYGEFMVKAQMITVEADVKDTFHKEYYQNNMSLFLWHWKEYLL